MISCDWLQVFGLCDELTKVLQDNQVIIAGDYYFRATTDNETYYISKRHMVTPIYQDMYYVYIAGEKVAEIGQCPRVPKMHPRSTSIRLDNKVLYHQGYIALLYDLMDAIKFKYKGITRIDLCYDCNWLHNHRNPRKFVRDILTVQAGKNGHIYRKGSRRGNCHFDRSPVGETYFSSISWGSMQGDYTCKIYNKTQEMAEVKTKPWIEDAWKMAGLKSSMDDTWYKTEQSRREKMVKAGRTIEWIDDEVWRFEISIKSEGQDILDMSSGLLFRLSPKFVENQERLEFLFHVWAKKAFAFFICTGQKNYRHYPELKIFEYEKEITYKPLHMSNKVGTGRTERLVARKLQELKLSVTYSDPLLASEIDGCEQYFRERATLKDNYVSLLRDLFNQYELPQLPTNEDYREMIKDIRYLVDQEKDIKNAVSISILSKHQNE